MIKVDNKHFITYFDFLVSMCTGQGKTLTLLRSLLSRKRDIRDDRLAGWLAGLYLGREAHVNMRMRQAYVRYRASDTPITPRSHGR